MKVVVAMDSFKGSLSSLEAGQAVKKGILKAIPEAEVCIRPLADGGEGTMEALVFGMGGILETIEVTGPLGDKINCSYGILEVDLFKERIGCIDKEKTYFIERLSTVRTKTELEYAVDIKTVLDIYHINKNDIEGGIISSVVPQITNIAKLAAEKIIKKEVMVLGPGVKTGLNILMDQPASLGADLVADAVAGITEYSVPLIIIDDNAPPVVLVTTSISLSSPILLISSVTHTPLLLTLILEGLAQYLA